MFSKGKGNKKMNEWDINMLFGLNFGRYETDSPLLKAIKLEKEEAEIKSLLAEENERNHRTGPVTDFEVALCLALQQNKKNIVTIMLDAEASLEGCPTHASVIHCYLAKPRSGLREDMLDLLIQRGGDRLISKADNKKSLMCFALSRGASVDDIKLLLKKGVNFNGCSGHKSPMLCLTLPWGGRPIKENVVKLLSDLGAKGNVTDEIMRRTPLEHALASCTFEIGALKILFDHQSAHFDMATRDLLHCAVRSHTCKLETVEFLVSQGIEPISTDELGKTALHFAAINNSSEEMPSIIKFLVDKGCPVNKKTPDGYTPLRKAVTKESDYEIFMALLAAGASIGRTDKNSILWLVLQTFYKRIGPCFKTDWLLLCLKFAYLRNKNFDLNQLILEDKGFEEFRSFGEKCLNELRWMETKNVGPGRTLRDFTHKGFFLPQKDAEVNPSELNKVLGILAGDSCPTYHEVIATRIGKKAMIEKLREVSVYSVKYSPGSHVARKVTLNYVCVCEIVKELHVDDLLSFIVAFYAQGNDVDVGHGSGDNETRIKRSFKRPAKPYKRLKMEHRLS